MKSDKSLLPTLPIVRETANETAPAYGTSSIAFPVGNGQSVSIDSAFFAGKSTLRLRHIKQCLKAADRENNTDSRKWFNREVRDAYHKALKHANQDAMRNGTPVSIGVSVRTGKLGDKTLTARFGYEMQVQAPVKEISNPVTEKKSKGKGRKSKPIENPVLSSEVRANGNPAPVEHEVQAPTV